MSLNEKDPEICAGDALARHISSKEIVVSSPQISSSYVADLNSTVRSLQPGIFKQNPAHTLGGIPSRSLNYAWTFENTTTNIGLEAYGLGIGMGGHLESPTEVLLDFIDGSFVLNLRFTEFFARGVLNITARVINGNLLFTIPRLFNGVMECVCSPDDIIVTGAVGQALGVYHWNHNRSVISLGTMSGWKVYLDKGTGEFTFTALSESAAPVNLFRCVLQGALLIVAFEDEDPGDFVKKIGIHKLRRPFDSSGHLPEILQELLSTHS
ncbi:hypothetical protein CC1G_01463 [Coprinopsis cinerea okayama7|uniref:Uncharacterized protein n=1 Tax=Coprinopsis cinerea (strain Okayama-7 / 130 / ATCC MYA-4618 / FGSC 9003) TaxID=240176 RepID=A8NYX5_COPC7|nr:hypothetical protein CC1G_01463 [Coprinopsis cinerea okayama7\|eukprot:XP_001837551.2 hypothetical protein CC1G_01463 [Coprinopsis cinerea okayama7\